jgi:hypothetical protein
VVAKYELLANWRKVAELVMADPEVFADLVRHAEVLDPHGQRWPRSKPHDDLAVVVLATV